MLAKRLHDLGGNRRRRAPPRIEGIFLFIDLDGVGELLELPGNRDDLRAASQERAYLFEAGDAMSANPQNSLSPWRFLLPARQAHGADGFRFPRLFGEDHLTAAAATRIGVQQGSKRPAAERNPFGLVAFGLGQFTGQRRRKLDDFAQERQARDARKGRCRTRHVAGKVLNPVNLREAGSLELRAPLGFRENANLPAGGALLLGDALPNKVEAERLEQPPPSVGVGGVEERIGSGEEEVAARSQHAGCLSNHRIDRADVFEHGIGEDKSKTTVFERDGSRVFQTHLAIAHCSTGDFDLSKPGRSGIDGVGVRTRAEKPLEDLIVGVAEIQDGPLAQLGALLEERQHRAELVEAPESFIPSAAKTVDSAEAGREQLIAGRG